MSDAPLNANQILFVDYVQKCLNAGIGYNQTGAISWVTTRLMAPLKSRPRITFPGPLGPSYGSLEADWDNLVQRGLLPTTPQIYYSPNGIPDSELILSLKGKAGGLPINED